MVHESRPSRDTKYAHMTTPARRRPKSMQPPPAPFKPKRVKISEKMGRKVRATYITAKWYLQLEGLSTMNSIEPQAALTKLLPELTSETFMRSRFASITDRVHKYLERIRKSQANKQVNEHQVNEQQ